ncbi:LysM peptidoglycan-binding domain-containing protein [Paenibacillus spongiae]|uniref:LysM peptidoglycan-binding domain-containing protein n=1 Tax=Paenibacillus spongiae TaxID=2909671 RepID=A0ABY5S3Q4_9BACL|nr:LysM peptidoglycan-binding domain-containing protein [Paenibacillus spongiae]UVI28103.1 LysM peptidoglycan-binding domain-containing protein [Paenibacillus spongiae]
MKIHIVKKGESLYLIAQKYDVSLEELLKLNPNITNPDVINVGEKVKIPSKAADMNILHQHVVVQGDTLWKLSKAWGIPLSEMIKANPQLKNPNVLLTGEVVNIPKPGTSSNVMGMSEPLQDGGTHHPLHPKTVMQGVQGLMGKIPTAKIPTGVLGGKKPTAPIESNVPITETAPTPAPSPMPEQTPAQTPVPAPTAAALNVKPNVAPEVTANVTPNITPNISPNVMPNVAPAPMPMQMAAAEKPVEKKSYPVHVQYEQHIDLFQQYGVPATEVMSLYDMPKMPEAVSPMQTGHHPGYGHGHVSPAADGYGWHQSLVSPASHGMPDWCPPENVGASTLPWGAPSPVPHAYGHHVMPYPETGLSPFGMVENCGPYGLSPASEGPYGYGFGPHAVSPANEGWHGGYGHGAVSPASEGPHGYGYDHMGISPAEEGPHGYGFGPSAVSPANVGPHGYGYDHGAVSPANEGPHGYGYGHGAVLPAGEGPHGYGYDHMGVSPLSEGPHGYGHGGFGVGPMGVSPAPNAPWSMPSFSYGGGGQMLPAQTADVSEKPCKCGCKDKRTDEEAAEPEAKLKLSHNEKKTAARKPAKKAVVRAARTAPPKRRSESLPWINR